MSSGNATVTLATLCLGVPSGQRLCYNASLLVQCQDHVVNMTWACLAHGSTCMDTARRCVGHVMPEDGGLFAAVLAGGAFLLLVMLVLSIWLQQRRHRQEENAAPTDDVGFAPLSTTTPTTTNDDSDTWLPAWLRRRPARHSPDDLHVALDEDDNVNDESDRLHPVDEIPMQSMPGAPGASRV